MNQSFAFEFLSENFQPKLINSYSNFQRFFHFLLCDLGNSNHCVLAKKIQQKFVQKRATPVAQIHGFGLLALFSIEFLLFIRVGRSIESERLQSGIEELGLLKELLNFQVEIPTLKCSNLTMKVGFSSPLQGKTTESNNFPTD